MGPYAGVDYNLTLCPPQSRLQHIYDGEPYAKLDVNPVPESTLSPFRDFGFGLCISVLKLLGLTWKLVRLISLQLELIF